MEGKSVSDLQGKMLMAWTKVEAGARKGIRKVLVVFCWALEKE